MTLDERTEKCFTTNSSRCAIDSTDLDLTEGADGRHRRRRAASPDGVLRGRVERRRRRPGARVRRAVQVGVAVVVVVVVVCVRGRRGRRAAELREAPSASTAALRVQRVMRRRQRRVSTGFRLRVEQEKKRR